MSHVGGLFIFFLIKAIFLRKTIWILFECWAKINTIW